MKRFCIIAICFFPVYGLQSQSLESLIQEGMANNPNIQMMKTRHQLAKEKVEEAYAVPNTEFSAGYFVSEPETRTGPQRFKLSIKQMLPWFGTISSKEAYNRSLADASSEEVVVALRKLKLDVTQSYYELYELQSKKSILIENVKLLETYETMALTSVEVGKASAVDVLKLQIRKQELEKSLKILEESYQATQLKLQNQLNRKEPREVIPPTDVEIPSTIEPIKPDSLQVHPELLKYDKLYASVSQAELLNKKNQSPILGFGIDYINVEKRPDMTFTDNGKDILMPMVSVSIPIFNNSFNSISKQNELRQKELSFQKEDRYNTLSTLLQKAAAERNNSITKHNTSVENLKQSKNAEEILIRNYETGTINFNDILDIQELQLKFQLAKIEAISSFYWQSAIINYLTQKL